MWLMTSWPVMPGIWTVEGEATIYGVCIGGWCRIVICANCQERKSKKREEMPSLALYLAIFTFYTAATSILTIPQD
jgi:hypothetical protein